MPFKSPVPFTDEYFDGALKTIMKGPPQDATSKKYSTKGAPAFDQYVKLVDEFNRQFTEEIGLVNVRANKLLQDPNVFGYDIEIELVYEPLSYRFNGARTEIRFVQPKVVLHIRNYYGIPDAVKRPQSFLNEAKKTAIGLAIRLALLERRLAADKLSLLALDDLLISLDMSNRDVVLNLLFDEYQKNYQIILFSHDKQFFQIAKHKIDHSTFKSDWLFWEFYINEKDPKKPLPKLFLSQSQLSIAYNHLLENDYPAAANYLRKHCEELLEDYLPEYCYANVEKQEPYTNHSLDSVISQSIDFLDRINQTIAKAELVKLKQYVKILLNPLSHTERGVQRHKTEIKSVIKILEDLESELKKIKYSKPILEKGETIFLNLTKNAKTNYQISFTLTQDLFVYDNGGGVDISKCKISSDRIKEYENGNEIEDKQFNYYPKLDIADAYKGITNHKDFAMPQIGDWHKLFTFGDGAALTTKMVLT